VVDAELLAIAEVNAAGGVNGMTLIPLILNGASDASVFASAMTSLFEANNETGEAALNPPIVFGGWTSASRKAMIPIIESHESLLFYPVQYEVSSNSPNLISSHLISLRRCWFFCLFEW
jgi:urea transport system substrate-binding protein